MTSKRNIGMDRESTFDDCIRRSRIIRVQQLRLLFADRSNMPQCLDSGHLLDWLACPPTDLPRDSPLVHRKALDYLSDCATLGTRTRNQKRDCLSVEGGPPANECILFTLTWPWPLRYDLGSRPWRRCSEGICRVPKWSPYVHAFRSLSPNRTRNLDLDLDPLTLMCELVKMYLLSKNEVSRYEILKVWVWTGHTDAHTRTHRQTLPNALPCRIYLEDLLFYTSSSHFDRCLWYMRQWIVVIRDRNEHCATKFIVVAYFCSCTTVAGHVQQT